MKRLIFFIPVILVILLGALFYRGLSLDPTAMPSALIDQPMPNFSLPILKDENRQVTADDIKGQVSLLNVWATWCISCRVEHPYLMAISKKEGIPIYAVNYKDDNDAARKWLAETGDPYVFNIIDQEGTLGLDLGVFGAPETYVIDKQGIIRYKHVGVIDMRVWEKDLKPVVMGLL